MSLEPGLRAEPRLDKEEKVELEIRPDPGLEGPAALFWSRLRPFLSGSQTFVVEAESLSGHATTVYVRLSFIQRTEKDEEQYPNQQRFLTESNAR
jgi:hypothetical protein